MDRKPGHNRAALFGKDLAETSACPSATNGIYQSMFGFLEVFYPELQEVLASTCRVPTMKYYSHMVDRSQKMVEVNIDEDQSSQCLSACVLFTVTRLQAVPPRGSPSCRQLTM